MYDVGDILWIISRDRPGVLPYRVIEEVTKKTLLGSTTQYVIETPGKNKSRILKDDDDAYTSIELVKEELISRAESAIDKMLSNGTNLISVWTEDISKTSDNAGLDEYGTSKKEALVPALGGNTIGEEMVTLPDGQQVKINFKGDIP